MKLFHKLVHLLFRVAKYDRAAGVVNIQQAAEHLCFFADGHFIVGLLDVGHRQLFPRDSNELRVGLILLCDPHDLRRHRGGKEDGLPLLRHILQDRFNILPEAHAEHFVRLVEDDHVQGVKL